MKTLKKYLSEEFKNKDFKNLYDEEKKLLDLSLKIHDYRVKSGLTQHDVAKLANVTQQQLSKIENGINCNILTFLRVCSALGLDFKFMNKKRRV